LIFCIVGVYLKLSESTSIECAYYNGDFKILGNLYCCSVKKDPKITTRESATITSVSENHKSEKTNSDVECFKIHYLTTNYFPRGLESFFENIKAISIRNSYLKEIHQEDLKAFPKLVELFLNENLLEVLEERLFDFNPDLQRMSFEYNKIVRIEPKIFDHLSKLGYLLLSENICINKGAIAYNSIEVKHLIKKAEAQCINSDSSLLENQLENDSKTLKPTESEPTENPKTENIDQLENLENDSKTLKPTKSEPTENPKTENIDQVGEVPSTTPKIETPFSPKFKPRNSSNCCKFNRISILFYLLFFIFYI